VPEVERYCLDTSAILAFVGEEEGASTIEALLCRAAEGEIEVVASAVSLMELYYITLQEQGEDQGARLVALAKSWPVRWIYPDEKALLHAGRLKAFHRISFADAVVAGAASLEGAVLVHKDPEFESLAGELTLSSLPYKRGK
jgi:predicted nucleic acid-binding protein